MFVFTQYMYDSFSKGNIFESQRVQNTIASQRNASASLNRSRDFSIIVVALVGVEMRLENACQENLHKRVPKIERRLVT
jgi:hypothetical protein